MLDVSEQRLAQLERPHGDRGSAAGYHDAVAHLRALVQVIERRLAYERSHPGLLPLP